MRRLPVKREDLARVGQENAHATNEMTSGIGDVAQAAESVAAVAEENSASAEEVTATVEELSAQVEEVSASAAELANLAQSLQETVAAFKLPGGDRYNAEPSGVAPTRLSTTPVKYNRPGTQTTGYRQAAPVGAGSGHKTNGNGYKY